MFSYHDEIEIEDFEYNIDTRTFYYPCPCGDTFELTVNDFENGEDIATCPSCSLIIRMIFTHSDIERVRGYM